MQNSKNIGNGEVEEMPGNEYLKQLRLRAKLKPSQVAKWSGIENYAKYENGSRSNPTPETIEQILPVLGARFSERRKALAFYGYVCDTPAPTEEDIAWACNACQPVLDRVPYPAYLVDIRGYVLAWNKHIPKLLDIRPSSLSFFLNPKPLTLYEALVHPLLRIIDRIENRERFLAYLIWVMRLEWELERCLKESWCQKLLTDLCHQYPEFKKRWEMTENPSSTEIPTPPLTTVRIHAKLKILEFQMATGKMIRDERFKVVYLMPVDDVTIEQCEQWQHSAEEQRSQ